ncbi:MAG: hypothetical protein ACI35O_06585 [Bacillaceae bacterium]
MFDRFSDNVYFIVLFAIVVELLLVYMTKQYLIKLKPIQVNVANE